MKIAAFIQRQRRPVIRSDRPIDGMSNIEWVERVEPMPFTVPTILATLKRMATWVTLGSVPRWVWLLLLMLPAALPTPAWATPKSEDATLGIGLFRRNAPGSVTEGVLDASSIPFNVFDYGATGLGVADDSGAIQAAINAAAAAGGGVIYFPPGTYLCKANATWNYGALGLGTHDYSLAIPAYVAAANRPAITFRGSGRQATILKKTSLGGRTAEYALFLTLATSVSQTIASYVTFIDLTLDGGQAGGAPFTSGDEALFFAAQTNHLTLERCTLSNARGYGLYNWQSMHTKIHHCHFELLDQSGVQNAVTFIGGNTFTAAATLRTAQHVVSGCTFLNNGQISLGVGGYSGSGELDNVAISDCHFLVDIAVTPNMTYHMELINVGTDPMKRTTVTNCTFQGGAGITLQGSDTQISNCVFRNMNRGGGNGNAIFFTNGANSLRISVSNCAIDTCTNEGIKVDGTRAQISSCHVTGCSVGISVLATAVNTQLTGNDLAGNITALTDAGTGTTRTDNQLTAGAIQGRAVLVAGTVTVNTAEVQANDNILVTKVVRGGTDSFLQISTIVAGTSFIILSGSAADTGTVFWKIIH